MFQSNKEGRNSDTSMSANFGALLYATKGLLAVQALGQNLALRIDLRKHESTDRENSIAARRALENHLWYLLDEFVGLFFALFSDKFSVTDRVKMFDRVTSKPGEKKVIGDATILKRESCLGESAIQ